MFVIGSGFLSFAKNMGKIQVNILVKIQAINTIKTFLIMLKDLLQKHLKRLQKNTQQVVRLVIKFLEKVQRIKHRITERFIHKQKKS